MTDISPREFKYPVAISEIEECLPHRDSAIWVNEVSWVRADEGECKIILDPKSNYADSGVVRDSSFIEWMAQSFGYVSACQVLSGLVGGKQKAQKAYLVGIRNFSAPKAAFDAKTGDWVRCLVRKSNELGPIILVDAKIFSSDGALQSSAQLKVFSQ